MKYKTLFRLALKAIGVLLFGQAVLSFVMGIGHLADWFLNSGMGAPWNFAFVQMACGMLEGAFAAYLFFGGEWIVNLAIPSNRPYCAECGYDRGGAEPLPGMRHAVSDGGCSSTR